MFSARSLLFSLSLWHLSSVLLVRICDVYRFQTDSFSSTIELSSKQKWKGYGECMRAEKRKKANKPGQGQKVKIDFPWWRWYVSWHAVRYEPGLTASGKVHSIEEYMLHAGQKCMLHLCILCCWSSQIEPVFQTFFLSVALNWPLNWFFNK